MAVESIIFHGIGIRAFDEYCTQTAVVDFRSSSFPDSLVARLQRYRVRLYVSEDNDFGACQIIPDEERRALDRRVCRAILSVRAKRELLRLS